MTTAPITAAPSWEARADLVVVGSGVAGLTAALDAQALGLRVLMVTKDAVGAGSTRWAQGGVAVVLDGEHDPGDSVAAHAVDTVSAGAGLAEPSAVGAILADGPAAVEHLLRRGAVFDPAADGHLARTREGGHSALRVLHAGGDATGAEVERALVGAARDDRLPMLTGHVAVDAALESRAGRGAGRDVAGLFVLDAVGRVGVLQAPAVLLATGGYSQLYAETTNPETATGDGLALALRAGALAADLEFVQFHPTALYTGDTGRRALVTEAVRGEGAVLVDDAGRRVMSGVHPMADLAPRDVVSAAITRLLAESGAACVYLDATGIPGFAQRFPTVDAACRAVGVDPARHPIPVTPAAHYCCGGVVTDTWGRTSVAGLYAAGEVARTGLHGANRLASNSLLEGLVVGGRAARAVAEDLRGPRPAATPAPAAPMLAAPIADRAVVQQAMSRGASIGRDAAGLAASSDQVEAVTATHALRRRAAVEDAAITLIAQAVLAAAGTRTESRGCHVRTDFPRTDDLHQRESLLVSLGADGRLAVRSAEPALGGVA
ncbi:MAG: L-aspartate oxidase [Pseudonocardia sp.]|nr:L-aspartate oxidase [Pseudonocardia sp.]